MKVFVTKLHYRDKKKWYDYLVLPVLLFLSLPYFIGVSVKNSMIKKGKIHTVKAPIRTISIGNLTTGGTGKTPITAELANFLVAKGEKPAILSRGYGGSLCVKNKNIISSGTEIFYSAKQAGDEPFWLASHCPGCAVLTSSDRVSIAEIAVNEFDSTVLILDDGFQHQKLQRDLNIVVIDSEKKFGNKFLLPAGPLREPVSEIYRADKIILVNKSGTKDAITDYKLELETTFNRPVFECNVLPDYLYDIKTNEIITDGEEAIAFCAIGQPDQFYNFLNEKVKEKITFPDHHKYSFDDLTLMFEKADKKNIKYLITTEKDAVKLQEYIERIDDSIRILALKLKLELDVDGVLND